MSTEAAITAWHSLNRDERNHAVGWLANGNPEAMIAAAAAAKASKYIDHCDDRLQQHDR